MRIDEIRIGERHRKDLGNIAALARSIDEIGLLQPVVVAPDRTLIAGRRRIEACRMLGWTEIPARVVDLHDIVRGEHDENVVRKDFTPSEAVAIGRALEPMEKKAARERSGARTDIEPAEKFSAGRALDKVAQHVGMSRPTYAKAKAVVEAAEQDPDGFGDLVEQMDATDGSVDAAHKALKRRRKQARRADAQRAIETVPVDDRWCVIHGDIREVWHDLAPESVDVIITDPPYPREFIPLYGTLAQVGAHVLKPGGSLLAMAGQSYLPEVMATMAGQELDYHWTVAYLTSGGQSAQLWQRKVNTFWKPVLWYIKGEYAGDWIGDVAKSDRNDKRFHHWGQSESGMADLIERFTYPGQTILDPFCGGGTTGKVAVAMGRRFIGVEIDLQVARDARARIAEGVA